jgi:hypothetical protein
MTTLRSSTLFLCCAENNLWHNPFQLSLTLLTSLVRGFGGHTLQPERRAICYKRDVVWDAALGVCNGNITEPVITGLNLEIERRAPLYWRSHNARSSYVIHNNIGIKVGRCINIKKMHGQ